MLELRTRLKNGRNKGGRLLRNPITAEEFDKLFEQNYSSTFEITFGDTILPIIQENQELFSFKIIKRQRANSEFIKFTLRTIGEESKMEPGE